MSFEQRYRAAQLQAQSRSHRQLLWLSGEQHWCYQKLRSIQAQLLSINSAAVFNKAVIKRHFDPQQQRNVCREQVSSKDCQQFLGQELDAIIFDGYSGFNPDSLALISGTLVAGGVLILITPSLAQWHDWPEPEMEKLWVQPFSLADVKRNFLSRLKEILLDDQYLSRYSQDLAAQFPVFTPQTKVADYRVAAVAAQAQFVHECRDYLLEVPRACAVLTAARGRGKSAALGLLANALSGRRAVYLSAWDAQAILQVNKFCSSELEYHSPAQLLDDAFIPEADALLLIDEAAAVSVEVLLKLSIKFPQCVYSTTTQGYEGTGQGFKLRFLEYLSGLDRQTKFYSLNLAMRWAENDPLESWLNRLLLLDMSASQSLQWGESSGIASNSFSIEKIEANSLIEKPKLLGQLYRLLAQAHYRTTPSDLRIILDSPNMHLWLTYLDAEIVAACLVAQEGRIDQFDIDAQGQDGEQLAVAIHRGQRRPRGNLIPQILIAQEGELEAKGMKVARVVRIATAMSQRRQALASKMLDRVCHWAKAHDFDSVGANFSMQDELLDFWQSAGFTLLRIGSQQDKITASYNALVLKSLRADAGIIRRLALQFHFKLQYQRQRLLLPAFVSDKITSASGGLTHLEYLQLYPQYYPWCLVQLECFAHYYRSLESIGHILLLLLKMNPQHWSEKAIGARYYRLLERYFLARKPLDEIYQECSLSGYRSLVKELRAAVKLFISALNQDKKGL